MEFPVRVVSVLLMTLVGSSLQEASPEAQGSQGGGGYGGGPGAGGAGGFGGQGMGRGFSSSQGGSSSRDGFNIVDTDEKYGYDFTFPGAKGYYYLLGANRGPGAQRGSSGGMQGGRQMGGGGGW